MLQCKNSNFFRRDLNLGSSLILQSISFFGPFKNFSFKNLFYFIFLKKNVRTYPHIFFQNKLIFLTVINKKLFLLIISNVSVRTFKKKSLGSLKYKT